jgi:hypothetical protein
MPFAARLRWIPDIGQIQMRIYSTNESLERAQASKNQIIDNLEYAVIDGSQYDFHPLLAITR